MLQTLTGKVALITGAGSGIGRGLAEVLGRRGMRLVVTDINEETLADISARLGDEKVAHIASPLDIRDANAWQNLVARVEPEMGPVQLLANIAGVTVAPTPAMELSPEAWSWVVDTNLTGTWNGVATVARRLRELGLPGHIVNTSSSQGLFGSPNFAAYNASKFAILGLSETLRIEFAEHNIGVSVVCPGATSGNILNNSRKIAPHLVAEMNKLKSGPGYSHRQTPLDVAEKIADGIVRNQLFIVTHPELRPIVEARWRVLDAALGTGMNPAAAENVCEVEGQSLACYQQALQDYR